MDQTRVNMTLDGMPLNEGEDQGMYFTNYPDLLSSMHSMKVINGASISGNGVAGYAGSIDFESVNLQRDTRINTLFDEVMSFVNTEPPSPNFGGGGLSIMPDALPVK